MLYSYTTSLKANNDTFKETCTAIESNLKGLKKNKPIIDVDGSITQIYFIGSKKITVQNDFEVDAVYVDSEIDLSGFLESLI